MIKQCIQNDCTDFSTDSTQLCDTHLERHIKRCEILSKIKYHGQEINRLDRELRAIKNGEGG